MIHNYLFLFLVFKLKGRYKGQNETKLVSMKTTASTNKIIAVIPLIILVK